MLRAARLMARLEFELEERTAELLTNALDLLRRVSGERIVSELELIFRERQPEQALQELDKLGILAAIHPSFMVDHWLIERVRMLQTGLAQTPWAGIKPDPVHYLGLMAFWLASDELTALMQRLNLRAEQRAVLKEAYNIRSNRTAIAEAEQASHLYRLLVSTSDDARLIAWLALKDEDEAASRQLVRFQAELRDVTPIIDGNYLKKAFKLQPGPLYRVILDTLRDARLDGLVATLDDERVIVEQILAEQIEDWSTPL
jgi:tRNA nucleotidyltransferase (CCA-adding enzyme)